MKGRGALLGEKPLPNGACVLGGRYGMCSLRSIEEEVKDTLSCLLSLAPLRHHGAIFSAEIGGRTTNSSLAYIAS